MQARVVCALAVRTRRVLACSLQARAVDARAVDARTVDACGFRTEEFSSNL